MFEVGGLGEQLQQLVTAVRATDGATVPAAGWVDLVDATQQAMNTLAAVQTIALAQLAATEQDLEATGELVEVYRGLGHQRLDAPDLVSGVLGLTATGAATRVGTAVDLATRHAPVIEAMAAGRLDPWRASVVSDELTDASPEACAQVLARVGDTLGGEPAGLLRRRLRRVLAAVDADAVRRKAARARSQRSLRRTAFGLGTDEWSATLPVEDSRAAWSVIDSLARSYVTDGRCERIEQARADALLDLIHARTSGRLDLHLTIPASLLATAATAAAADAGDTGSDDGDGVEGADVLVPVTGFGTTGVTHVRASWLAALAGLTPTSAGHTPGCEATVVACADANGAQTTLPIPTTGMDRAARRRAKRAAVRRAKRLAKLNARRQAPEATDPEGLEPYRPPEWMIEFVKTRDGSCRFPGCTVATRFCDLDHVTAWPAGPTHPDNLACLCRRHHRIKQRAGWHAVLHPDGSMTWIDPTGQTRTTTPVDHLQLDTHPDTHTAPTTGPTAGAGEPATAPSDAASAATDAGPGSDQAGAELPSLLEDDLDHLHDHHLIALACRPTTVTWRTRRALHTGSRITTNQTAAQLHTTTRAGIELLTTPRPMQLDPDYHHGHRPTGPHPAAPGPDDDPPF